MYQTFKFKGREENFWFTSDAHVNQVCAAWENPLWHMRGYSSVSEHRKGFIQNWNKVCDERSTVFHLGDFTFEDFGGQNFQQLINDLNYKTLYCFLGNHLSGQKDIYFKILYEQFPNLKGTDQEVYPLVLKLSKEKEVIFVPEYLDVKINGVFLTLCHYPLISHSRQQKKSILLCGHSHNNCELTSKEKGQGLRLDVGFDAWKRPISLVEIKNHLKDRAIDARDHHNESCLS